MISSSSKDNSLNEKPIRQLIQSSKSEKTLVQKFTRQTKTNELNLTPSKKIIKSPTLSTWKSPTPPSKAQPKIQINNNDEAVSQRGHQQKLTEAQNLIYEQSLKIYSLQRVIENQMVEITKDKEAFATQLQQEAQSKKDLLQQQWELREKIVEKEKFIENLQQMVSQMISQKFQTVDLKQNDREQLSMQLNSSLEQVNLQRTEIAQLHKINQTLTDKLRIIQSQQMIPEFEVIKQKPRENRSPKLHVSHSELNYFQSQSPMKQIRKQQELSAQKIQLESLLEQSQQNKQNLEKALEIKLADALKREQLLEERIQRQEKQLKSRNYFDQDKRQLAQLEDNLKQLKLTNSNLEKDVQKQQNQLSNKQKELEKFQQQITLLTSSIKQLESQIQNNGSSDSKEVEKYKQQLQKTQSKLNELDDLKLKLKECQDKIFEQMVQIQQSQEKNQQAELQRVQLNQSQNKISELELFIKALQLSGRTGEQEEEETTQQQQISLLQKEISDRKQLQQAYEDEIQCLKSKNQNQQLDLNFQLMKLNQLEDLLQQQTQEMKQFSEQNEMLKTELKEQEQIINNFQRKQSNPSSNWGEELNRIQFQVENLGCDLDKFKDQTVTEKEKLFTLEWQNCDVKDQLLLFETDLNETLAKELEFAKQTMLDLCNMIKSN